LCSERNKKNEEVDEYPKDRLSKMDDKDREKIKQNLVELVEETNLDTLIPELCERGVFTAGMIEKYTDKNTELHERKRHLYMDLQTRGPEAFRNLIDSLMVTGHLDLFRRLEPHIDIRSYFTEQPVPQPRQGTKLVKLPAYMLEDETGRSPRLQTSAFQNVQCVSNLGTEPLKVVVKKATAWMDGCTSKGVQPYRMRSSPRGYFFMINNVQFVNNIEKVRIGAEVDERNLEELFKQFGYIVEKYRDEGFEDMKRKIRDFAQRREHSRYDSCVVAIMSHGKARESKQNSTIISADGRDLEIDWVLEQFNNENAQSLAAIPKIFFFQTCRGGKKDFGVKLTAGHTESDGSSSDALRSVSDILIGYSTLPGFTSNRDKYLGTWYIEAICEVFMEHACDTDVEDMLKMVDQKLATLKSEGGSLQTSSYENRGFRKLYFNPGL